MRSFTNELWLWPNDVVEAQRNLLAFCSVLKVTYRLDVLGPLHGAVLYLSMQRIHHAAASISLGCVSTLSPFSPSLPLGRQGSFHCPAQLCLCLIVGKFLNCP